MSMAFVFPGQGSQEVGMGKALADAFAPAREVFEEVNDALGQNLSNLMFEGPDDELRLTENAQPALMAVSMAVMRTLAAEGGFSLDGGWITWPAIRWANIRRWPPPAPSDWATRRGY